MPRLLAPILALVVVASAVAQAPKPKPKPFPNVSWALYHDSGIAKVPNRDMSLVYELEYLATGEFRLRGGAQSKDLASTVGEYGTFPSEDAINSRNLGFLLNRFVAARKQIAGRIVASLSDGKVRKAMIAEGDLFTAHLVHAAAKGEQDDAKKQQLTSLAGLIVETNSEQYTAAVGKLNAIARRWLAGKMKGQVMNSIGRGPGLGKARLYFVTHNDAQVAIIQHRTGRIATTTAKGDRGYATLASMKRRAPGLYLAWRGDREGLEPVRGG